MNTGKIILLLGAAYYLFKDKLNLGNIFDYNSQVEELKGEIDALNAEIIQKEDEHDAYVNQVEGDLKDRLECTLTAKIWNVSVGEFMNPGMKHLWNSLYWLKIKNKGSMPINIRGVRVFWTVLNRGSNRVPWVTGSWTIQPGSTIELKLYGFLSRKHFPNDSDIEYMTLKLTAGGFQSDDRMAYAKKYPITAEADFLVNANGTVKRQVLKNIPGTLIARRDVYTLYANEWHTLGDGTNVSAFNVDKEE